MIRVFIISLLLSAFVYSDGVDLLRGVVARKKAAAGGGGTDPTNADVEGWWDMEEASGDLTDESNSIALSSVGTPLYAQTGKVGNAITFDGSTDAFISANNILNGTIDAYPFSIGTWVKTSTAAQGVAASFVASNKDNSYAFQSVEATGAIRSSIRNTSTLSLITTGTGFGDGSWYFVVGVYVSATERYLYVDAVEEQGSASETSATFDTDWDEFGIGRLDDSTPGAYFNGEIDEVFIFGKALSADEITWLHNGGSGRTYSDLSTP